MTSYMHHCSTGDELYRAWPEAIITKRPAKEIGKLKRAYQAHYKDCDGCGLFFDQAQLTRLRVLSDQLTQEGIDE